MASPIESGYIAMELCKALGIDPTNVVSFNITGIAERPVMVSITRLVLDDEAEKMIEIVKAYELLEKE